MDVSLTNEVSPNVMALSPPRLVSTRGADNDIA